MWYSDATVEDLLARANQTHDPAERIDCLLQYGYRSRFEPDVLGTVLQFMDATPSEVWNESLDRQAHRVYLEQHRWMSARQYDDAFRIATDALALYEQIGDARGIAETLIDLSFCEFNRDNHDAALRYADRLKALVAEGAVDDETGVYIDYNLASIYNQLELPELAQRYVARTVAASKKLDHDPRVRVGALWLQGTLLLDQNKVGDALLCTRAGVEVASVLGDVQLELLLRLREGHCLRREGALDEARDVIVDAIALAEQHRSTADWGDFTAELARVERDDGELNDARKWFVKSLATFEQADAEEEQSLILRELSEVCQLAGRLEMALGYLRRHLELEEKIRSERHDEEKRSLAAQFELKMREKDLAAAGRRNAELQELNDLLHDANQSQRKLLEIVGHDLRSPLSAAQTSLALITDVSNAANPLLVRRSVNRIDQALAYMSDMIESLQRMAQVDTGSLRPDTTTLRLDRTLSRVANRQAALAGEKEIDLVIGDLPALLVRGDSLMVEEILDNVVNNAVKYSYPETRVEISVEIDGGFTRVKVVDSGVGIDPEETPKLFTKFGKLANRPPSGDPSTGLGLYNARELARLIGGDIYAESEGNDQGCTFTIELELADDREFAAS